MERYLEEMSYSKLDLEFEVVHGWLRAADDYEQYLEWGRLGAYLVDYWLRYPEMLGWSRWQIGWLNPDQVHCVDDDVTTVAIEPISGRRDGVLLAAIHVSATKVIVVENRRALGRDSSTHFFNEGVLVYTVDAPSSERPLKVAGDGGDGRVAGHPLLSPGQSVRVWGYEIAVVSDDGTTSTVRISRIG